MIISVTVLNKMNEQTRMAILIVLNIPTFKCNLKAKNYNMFNSNNKLCAVFSYFQENLSSKLLTSLSLY